MDLDWYSYMFMNWITFVIIASEALSLNPKEEILVKTIVAIGLNEVWKPETVCGSPEVFTEKRHIGMRVWSPLSVFYYLLLSASR